MSRPGRASWSGAARAPLLFRSGLALVTLAYACVRLGGVETGLKLAPGVALFVLADVCRSYWWPCRDHAMVEAALIWLQVALVGVTSFAPAPFGVGSVIPPRVLLDSPEPGLLLCFLVSNASADRPSRLWAAGAALIAVALAVRQIMLSDPATVTKAMVDFHKIKTLKAFLATANSPYFFNFGLWKAGIVTILLLTALLTLTLYRARFLARRRVAQESGREALAAFFSPRLVDLVLTDGRDAEAWREEHLLVLDADLVGFTGIAEARSPEAVGQLLKTFRSTIDEAVFAADGAVIAYEGDGVVALIGLGEPNLGLAAAKALTCARSIQRNWASADSQPGPPVAIGLEYGPVRLGIVGLDRSRSLLALGSTMTVAADLRRAARAADAAIMVGPALRAVLEVAGVG